MHHTSRSIALLTRLTRISPRSAPPNRHHLQSGTFHPHPALCCSKPQLWNASVPRWASTASTSGTSPSLNESYSETTRLFELISSRADWRALQTERGSLRKLCEDETLWERDPNKAVELGKRLKALEESLEQYEDTKRRYEELREMVDLAQEEQDTALLTEVSTDLQDLLSDLQKYSLQLLMSSEADQNGCFIEFRAGAGGAEACDWVQMLVRMYERWAVAQGHSVKLVDELKGEIAGLKSATLHVDGPYAYGWCKHEAGVHRFVRQSPFDSNERRHTSFVSLQVFPATSSSSEPLVEIQPNEIKVDVMRAQGAGGQHVNTTESAVRIVHIPTGTMVTCQNQRSQHQNRAVAMQMLQSKLYQRQLQEQADAKSAQRDNLDPNAWGSQIRSYVLHPYKMIKDLRTGHDRSDVENVLDGDLEGFMEAALVHFGNVEQQRI
ncbi:hypothetical protein HDU85_006098 [Gaertneriomyces sp. JEL0708]|nr:hypothetical protein HDU85_006098 [Gaertneriomyces sp. JEL0708]